MTKQIVNTPQYYSQWEQLPTLTALTEPQWMEDIFELCEAWPGVIKVIS